MALRAALLALPFDAVPPLPEELSEETETSETRQPNTSSSKSVRSKDALTVSAMSICTKVCGDASSSPFSAKGAWVALFSFFLFWFLADVLAFFRLVPSCARSMAANSTEDSVRFTRRYA